MNNSVPKNLPCNTFYLGFSVNLRDRLQVMNSASLLDVLLRGVLNAVCVQTES